MEKPKLTLEMLDTASPRSIVLSGTTVDSPEGLHMNRTGKPMVWVVVAGGYGDWAMYCSYSPEFNSPQFTADFGDKVLDHDNLKRILDMDKEVLSRYRH